MQVSGSNSLNSTPNPVVTEMAGFAALGFPLLGRVSVLVFGGASSAVDPVVTEMAGFAGRCFRLPGGGTWMPAAFR